MTADDPGRDDLSYDEPASGDLVEERAGGQVLTGLVVLLITVLGAPQVWDALRGGGFGPALLFYPVLAVAVGHLALRGRGR